ncbi:hypothetical protein BHM03_00054607 [Ensete ventricosum]|uniref:Uncharacterized protein n=1 Tax=Ensete ventricosum TaxID=4639 RepID=A0A445MM62_ENSVE|nr:hypothetical protein BHM03_00054607 [Ensete ventricosum]
MPKVGIGRPSYIAQVSAARGVTTAPRKSRKFSSRLRRCNLPRLLGSIGTKRGWGIELVQRPKSIRELCRASLRDKGEGYHALKMTNMPEVDPDTPLQPRWSGLKHSTQIWQDGTSVVEFKMGILNPNLAFQLYASPSEVLIDRVTKSLVWVSV